MHWRGHSHFKFTFTFSGYCMWHRPQIWFKLPKHGVMWGSFRFAHVTYHLSHSGAALGIIVYPHLITFEICLPLTTYGFLHGLVTDNFRSLFNPIILCANLQSVSSQLWPRADFSHKNKRTLVIGVLTLVAHVNRICFLLNYVMLAFS